ncbi:MAG: hypothetical protein RIE52_05090 [Balneola sp.]|jgi:hypothetical protein
MDLSSWLSLLNVLVLLFSLYQLATVIAVKRSSFLILLSSALLTYLISNIIYLIDDALIVAIRFLNTASLVCILSALFNLIRESKPIFARFPTILGYLPFVILLFIPLVLDQPVIYNLILGTFQGGALIVSILIFSINQKNQNNYLLLIIGTIVCLIAFILFWMVPLTELQITVVTELLLITGVLLISLGTKQSQINNPNV